MIQYEKIELDYHLPIKLIDIYFEDHLTTMSKHYHNSIELLIPILGKLELDINTEHLIISEGDLYLVNSQAIHGMHHTIDSEIYKGYALQINYDYIKKYYPAIDNYVFNQPNKKIKKLILKDVYNIIQAYDNLEQFSYINIESNVLHLVYLLLSNLLEKKNSLNSFSKQDQRIIKITKYIDKHYNEDISINDLANEFDLSPVYLSRYFKSHLNITIKEYLTSIRLKKARHDLLFSDYSILEIAYMHGFHNPKSFTNTFKKYYSKTPAKYREEVRK